MIKTNYYLVNWSIFWPNCVARFFWFFVLFVHFHVTLPNFIAVLYCLELIKESQVLPTTLELDLFLFRSFWQGAILQCTFHHDDPRRKSFNYVEVFYNNLGGTKFLKPASAVVTLKTILNSEHFFIQESAFKRIDDYFHMEFKEPSLISFAKLLQSEIEDFGNIDSLPADAKLFLTKAKKWIEESSEIEVLPPPVSGYAILFRRANHLSISQMRFSKWSAF